MRRRALIAAAVTMLVGLPGLATPASGVSKVGGILRAPTVWTKAGGPYEVTSTVQIAPGASLTIEAGTMVTGSAQVWFQTAGALLIRGTSVDPVLFEGQTGTRFFESLQVQGGAPKLDVQFARIQVGDSLTNGGGTFNEVAVRDSVVRDITNGARFGVFSISQPASPVIIERNVFLRSGGVSVPNGLARVAGNRFVSRTNSNGSWVWVAAPSTVTGNSFEQVLGVTLEAANSPAGEIDATGNYWGTTDPAVIDRVISDNNDTLVRQGRVKYQPFASSPPGSVPAAPAFPPTGYVMVTADGTSYRFGHDPGTCSFKAPAASSIGTDPSSTTCAILTPDGQVFSTAVPFAVATAHLGEAERAVSVVPTPDGRGWWIATSRGRVAASGAAPSLGDLRARPPKSDIVSMVRTPSGRGYYLLGADGAVYAFGDAKNVGSTSGLRLNQPMRGIVLDPDGVGYWLVAADGGVFAFQARFQGSMGASRLNRPIVGMISFGDGYLMVASDGGIFNFSARPFYGSLGSRPLAHPVVAVAASYG